MFKVDQWGKITISLGGICSLGCKHCYTMTKAFNHQPAMTPASVILRMKEIRVPFSTICISGDTDCFLDPIQGLELIEMIVDNYHSESIMFTTRLVPSKFIIDKIIEVSKICKERNQLFIPCISLVSYTYPNTIERSNLVPSSIERLDFLNFLCDSGLSCFLTLRPTFPFSLVPKNEIVQILDYVAQRPTTILGEVLLSDSSNQVLDRLHITSILSKESEVSEMTFLDQPSSWKKYLLVEEVEFIRDLCENRNIPYFLRSVSAINYTKEISSRHDQKSLVQWQDFEIESIFP
jgi:hypothetical protein